MRKPSATPTMATSRAKAVNFIILKLISAREFYDYIQRAHLIIRIEASVDNSKLVLVDRKFDIEICALIFNSKATVSKVGLSSIP